MEGEVYGRRLVCACLLIRTHHSHMHYNHLVTSALTPITDDIVPVVENSML